MSRRPSAGRTTRRHRTIYRLPVEIRELIGRGRAQGLSVAELRDATAAGHPVSRFVMERWCRFLDQNAGQLVHQRMQADAALAAALGPGQVAALSAVSIELLQGSILDLLGRRAALGKALRAAEIRQIADALAKLAAAAKTQEGVVRQVLARAAEQSAATARGAGVSEAAIAHIRSAIYGLMP